MVHCAAVNCDYQRRNNYCVSYHRLPKNLDLKEKWVHAIGRTDLPKEHQVFLCSNHLEENCFKASLSLKLQYCGNEFNKRKVKKLLKQDAIATMFSYREPSKQRKTSIEREAGREQAQLQQI